MAEIFWHNWLLNECFSFHITQRLFNAFALPGESRPGIILVKMNGKTSINSISPNLWAPTAGLLQSLTVLQQCVYQMKFRNVCKVRSDWWSLYWSGAEHYRYCCQVNRESVSLPVFA